MKGYSNLPRELENVAMARLEGVNASYKDLAQVCGRIRGKPGSWAIDFLERASKGDIPVLYKAHNRRMGHRKQLGGRKGRYPKKAAGIVLGVLQSAIANGRVRGIGEEVRIVAASANKKMIYPRIASKGRYARSFLSTSRVEIIVQGSGIPKGVEVTPPAKPEAKAEVKKPEARHEKKAEHKKPEAGHEPAKEEKKAEAKPEKKPEPKKEEKHPAKKHETKHEPKKPAHRAEEKKAEAKPEKKPEPKKEPDAKKSKGESSK